MTGTAPPALDGAHPLNRLAAVLTVLLALAGLASLATAVPLFLRARALDQVAAETTTLLAVLDADQVVRAAFGINALLTIGTGIVFLTWQYRHAVNAELLRDGPLSLGPGWAVGGWLIPGANLVLPFLQLRQAARVCGPVPRVVTAWSVLFVAGGLLFSGSAAIRRNHREPIVMALPVSNADWVAGAAMAVYAAAAVLAILVVRALTDRQQRILA